MANTEDSSLQTQRVQQALVMKIFKIQTVYNPAYN